MTDGRYPIEGAMPFDHSFVIDESGAEELCSCTGYYIVEAGEEWFEYRDSFGNLHYGR